MRPPVSIFRRALTLILAVSPLVASADLCTIGALTGRAELACAMESGGPACAVAPAPAPKCARCEPAAPACEAPRSHGPTCCELRPQAAAVAGQPVLAVPLPTAHPAAAATVAVPGVSAMRAVRIVLDDGRAPPGDVSVLRSPRAPPLG
jgi:hypothetical protein